jgi:hypothetical protein
MVLHGTNSRCALTSVSLGVPEVCIPGACDDGRASWTASWSSMSPRLRYLVFASSVGGTCGQSLPSTRLITTDVAPIAAASSARLGPITRSRTFLASGSSVGPSLAALSANTSEPRERPGQGLVAQFWNPTGFPASTRGCGGWRDDCAAAPPTCLTAARYLGKQQITAAPVYSSPTGSGGKGRHASHER